MMPPPNRSMSYRHTIDLRVQRQVLVHLGLEHHEFVDVGNDVAARPRLDRADDVEPPGVHASAIAAFQEPITSSAEKRPDRRYMSARADDLELLAGRDCRGVDGGSEGRDDLPRIGPVDDADALVAGRKTCLEEREQDLVPFPLAGEQRADVVARLGFKSGDAQDNGIACHGQFKPFRLPGAAARALRACDLAARSRRERWPEGRPAPVPAGSSVRAWSRSGSWTGSGLRCPAPARRVN